MAPETHLNHFWTHHRALASPALSSVTPSNRILTIPNAISFVRVLAVPYFWWLIIVEDNVALAGWLIAVVAGTDWLDGYLARRLDQVTELGKALDPIADRLMLASAVIGGLITGVVPAVIGYPLLARELLMTGVTIRLARRGAKRLEVRWLGKLATVMLYSAIPAFYLASAGVLEVLMQLIAWVGGVGGLVLYWVVAFSYLGDARRHMAAVESRPEPEEN